ncbi:hypothetical protein [Corallococcus sp. AB018]|uniref:hypothetical protein n=1 Tax=Corallococcus sp. AB018 TaxID=2316715 RepID=UPI001315AB9C|nr:hypothetical protein [Corallococcus sp. AB018]
MKGRPGGWESELLVAYLLPSGHVAAYSVPLVRVLFVFADVGAEVALHEQRKRIASAFVVVELAPGRRVYAVKTLRDVDQRFADRHVMQSARVERFEDGTNQPRVVRSHHPKVVSEVCADEVSVEVADRAGEEVSSLSLVE